MELSFPFRPDQAPQYGSRAVKVLEGLEPVRIRYMVAQLGESTVPQEHCGN